MKGYTDYTTEELDELYAKLSETAQDFVYGGIIPEEVANIGKQTALHIDKWQTLNTLVLETILGIVPSSVFASEVSRRLQVEPDIAAQIVSHMDNEIFSVLREDSIEGYADTNEKNVVDGAIFDESQDDIARDPYREDADIPHSRGPVITEEKLHIVDELFAPYQPKVKELTPADGSVRVPNDEAPHDTKLFANEILNDAKPVEQKNLNTPTSSFVITREMLEAEELASKGEGGSFVGMDKVDSVLSELPKITPSATGTTIGAKETTVLEKPKSKKIRLHIEKKSGEHNDKKLLIHIEKLHEDGKRVVENIPTTTPSVDKKDTTNIPLKTKPTDEAHPSDILPHSPNPHYTVDPYKEVL